MVTKTIVKEQLKALDKLIATSQQLDKKKVDLEGAPASLVALNSGKWTFNNKTNFFGSEALERIAGLKMETNALRQLLSRVSVPYFGKGNGTTMDSLDWETMLQKYPKQFAAILNDLLPQVESKGLLVRTSGKDIRAVLTDKYGAVDNTPILLAAREILAEAASGLSDLRIVRSTVERDRIDLRIVFKDFDLPNAEPMPRGATSRGGIAAGKPYGMGVYIGNNEIGNGSMNIAPMWWRGPCTNSTIVKNELAVNLRHIGNPAALLNMVKTSFLNVLPASNDLVTKVYTAANKDLPNLADVVNGFAKLNGWGDETTKQVLIGTEGQHTVLGLVNGVSFAATQQDGTAAQVDMEMQAGAILVAPDSLFAKAARAMQEAKR